MLFMMTQMPTTHALTVTAIAPSGGSTSTVLSGSTLMQVGAQL